ncbi:MAG: hypothetical protein HOP95_12310 [Sphingomonas sp.]|nr:hypothetical protein [Sphingomonas sp.]
MAGRIPFIAALSCVALAAAAVAAPAAKKVAPQDSPPNAQARQLIQNCDAHKFETTVHEVVDGQPQQSKVKLCGNEGQTDAEWIGTLKDAITKLNANKEMPAAVRDQIIAAIYAEVARLENSPAQSSGRTPALDGLAPLPGIGQPKAAAAAPLPAPRRVAPAPVQDEYAALPPLPTAPTAPTHVLGMAAGASLVPLPRPRISFDCYEPGGAQGPCTDFTRQTLLTVQAGEDLPADTSLRFVRDGDPKADVNLAQLKKGRSMRLTVPTDVCLHAVGGKLELQIVRSGQAVGSEGPFNLTC